MKQSLRTKFCGYEFSGANAHWHMGKGLQLTEHSHRILVDFSSMLPPDKLGGLREGDSGRALEKSMIYLLRVRISQ